MKAIVLRADGALLQGGKTVRTAPLRRLGMALQLEDGSTLRSFFRMARRYPVLCELNAFFPTLLERAEAAPRQNCTSPGTDRLELSRTVEMIGHPGKPRMEIYTTLAGVGPEGRFEIRFIQLEDLLDVPLILGPLRHVVLGDKVDRFEFETVYSLFEFIEGVTWELGFHGTPMQCKIGG
ncbi:MAG: hypothetical protein PHX58_10105 [Desulfovibrio sp.]|jgi:hypothetical protein|nr:hypothetical protein [Desulfovibrio sp.]